VGRQVPSSVLDVILDELEMMLKGLRKHTVMGITISAVHRFAQMRPGPHVNQFADKRFDGIDSRPSMLACGNSRLVHFGGVETRPSGHWGKKSR
jgi:hypothetical protein